MSVLYTETELLDGLKKESCVDKVVLNEQGNLLLVLNKRKNKTSYKIIKKVEVDIVMIDGTKFMYIKNENQLYSQMKIEDRKSGKKIIDID